MASLRALRGVRLDSVENGFKQRVSWVLFFARPKTSDLYDFGRK